MVDDESGVAVTVYQRRDCIEIAAAREVYREVVPNRCARDAIDAGVARLEPHFLFHHDAYTDRAGVFFQSAMTSATSESSGSTGFTRAKPPGWARCTSTA
jgi:hypothetical protein